MLIDGDLMFFMIPESGGNDPIVPVNEPTKPVIDPTGEQTLEDGPKEPQAPEVDAAPKWLSQLPDELKGNERLSKYNSIGDAFKDLLDGSKGVEMNYELPKTLNEFDPSGTLDKNISNTIKEMKLPKEQAEAMYNAFAESYKEGSKELQENGVAVCEKHLRESWGEKYDQNIAYMKKAYETFVPKDSPLEKGLKDTLAENNPFVIQLLASMGESISEHSPPRGSGAGPTVRKGGFLTRDENEKFPWG